MSIISADVKPRTREALTRTFASMGVRTYRWWFLGQCASLIGFFAQSIGLALLGLQLTGSGFVVGLLAAMAYLPTLVFGLWAGMFADRFDRCRLMVATQVIMMVAAGVMGWITLAGNEALWPLLALAGVSGVAYAFDQPVRRVIAGDLVPTDLIANAVSLNGALNQSAQLLGPLVGGVLVASVGAGWCFVVNAVTSVPIVGILVWMSRSATVRRTSRTVERGAVAEGLRHVWRDGRIRRRLMALGAVALFGYNWAVLMPLIATRELGGGPLLASVLLAAMGTGSVVGVLFVASRGTRSESELARGAVGFGTLLALLALMPTVPTMLVVAVATGVASTAFASGCVVSMQLAAVAEVRGRVMSVYGVVVLGAHALGGPLSGAIADLTSPRAAVVAGSVVAGSVGARWLRVATRIEAAGHAQPIKNRRRTAAS